MEFEWVPCNICDSVDTKHLFTHRYKDEEFQIVQCLHCGLVYLNPRPIADIMRKFYPDPDGNRVGGTPGFRPDPGIIPRIGFRSKYLKFYGKLADNVRDIKILDYVCRNGSFLQLLKEKYGWSKMYGTEIRPNLARQASELGFQIHLGPIEQARFPDDYFDVIVTRHTLEHSFNPRVAFQELHRILKDGGLLRIELPNMDSLSRLISGRQWAGFYIPWHLYYFSPGTMAELLRRTGFQVKESRTLPYPHFLLSSGFALLDRVIPRKSKKAIAGVFKPGNSLAVGAMLAPLNYLSVLINRGDEIMIICQKAGKAA